MKRFTIFIITLMCMNVLYAQEECTQEVIEAAEKEIKEYVKRMKVEIINNNVDEYKSSRCIMFKPNSMSVQEFIVLSENLEENPKCAELLSDNDECFITQMTCYEDGVYCNHIYYRKGKNHLYKTVPVPDEHVRNSLENEIKWRKEQLRLLKQQQRYLNVDNSKLITDALISEIPSTDIKILDKLLRDAAAKLQKKGIKELSKYYNIDYKPSENENADFVRKILSPIDEVLNKNHVIPANFMKYWEILKLTPDIGMIIGNTAAKVHIYLMERDLKQEIAQLEQRLGEIDRKTRASTVKEGPYEQRTIKLSGTIH